LQRFFQEVNLLFLLRPTAGHIGTSAGLSWYLLPAIDLTKGLIQIWDATAEF